MKVLIVGDSCGALASARELGAAGWTVGIGSDSRFGWAAASRWTSHWHYLPPLDDPEGFIRTVNRVTEKHGYEVFFVPVTRRSCCSPPTAREWPHFFPKRRTHV